MTPGPLCLWLLLHVRRLCIGLLPEIHVPTVGPQPHVRQLDLIKLSVCRRTMYLKAKNISCRKPTARERSNEMQQSHAGGLASGPNHSLGVCSYSRGVRTNHLSDHHHIGSQILVDTKDVQDTDVPEDDIHAVDHAAIAHVGLLL